MQLPLPGTLDGTGNQVANAPDGTGQNARSHQQHLHAQDQILAFGKPDTTHDQKHGTWDEPQCRVAHSEAEHHDRHRRR